MFFPATWTHCHTSPGHVDTPCPHQPMATWTCPRQPLSHGHPRQPCAHALATPVLGGGAHTQFTGRSLAIFNVDGEAKSKHEPTQNSEVAFICICFF